MKKSHMILLGAGSGIDMNEIAGRSFQGQFNQDDLVQFAQLIGYSIVGFHELSYVPDTAAEKASKIAKEIDPAAGGCRDRGCGIHCGVEEE